MSNELFIKLEQAHGLPPGLLDAVWAKESSRGQNMLSPVGARGHFQFMPDTAKAYGLQNPDDLTQSATAAARMFADLSKQYGGDMPKMLAAYNWGSGNVDRKGLARAPAETRDYIQKVSASVKPATTGRDMSADLFGDAPARVVPASTGSAPSSGRDFSADLFGPSPAAVPFTKGEKFAKGLRDPVDSVAQTLVNVLPAGLVQAGNRANNWLADTTGLVARLPEGGVDQQVRQDERAYQARREASGDTGVDWMRVGGNVLNPANLVLAARVPAAATFGGRVLAGAGAGAASSVLNPVAEGDFWTEKGKQAAVGAAAGAAVPAVTNSLARAVSPAASTNPQLQALRAEGVRPTIGQTLGGAWNQAEQKLMSVPLVGDMIANARRSAADDVGRAAHNRALAPIGQQLPRGTTGREAVQFTENAIGDRYDALLPRLTAQADPQFTQGIGNLRQMVNTGAIDPNAAAAFNRILDNDVLSKFGGQGAMTGETLKRVESDLGQQISRLAQSTDADQRLVADALRDVQDQLRQMLVRRNPAHAQELGQINTAWANFKRVQRASSMVGAQDGVFSPAQLQSAVKATDRSKDKARFARGNALMQDLSDPAKAVLGANVPDSGTAGRIMLGGGLSFLDPSGIAPFLIGGGAAAYARPVQNALAAAIAARPQAAQPAANALRRTAPMLVPLGAQIGLQALD